MKFKGKPYELYDYITKLIEETKHSGEVLNLNDIDVSEITNLDNFASQIGSELTEKRLKIDISNWDLSNLISAKSAFDGAHKWIYNFEDTIANMSFENLMNADWMFNDTHFTKPVKLNLPNALFSHHILGSVSIEHPIEINSKTIAFKKFTDFGIAWHKSDYFSAIKTVIDSLKQQENPETIRNNLFKELSDKLAKFKKDGITFENVYNEGINIKTGEGNKDVYKFAEQLSVLDDKGYVTFLYSADDAIDGISTIKAGRVADNILLQQGKMSVDVNDFVDFNEFLLGEKELTTQRIDEMNKNSSKFLDIFFKGMFAGKQTPYAQIALRAVESENFLKLLLPRLCRGG